jgi:hypothetical protein
MSRLLSTIAIIVMAVVAVLGTVGVLHFQNADDKAGITVEKKDLEEKTEKAVEKTEEVGGEILDKTGKALHKAAADLRESSQDPPHTPATTPAPHDKVRQPDSQKNSSNDK